MLKYSKGNPTPNDPKTIKTPVFSSAESETGGTIKNAQIVIPLRRILKNVHLHWQPNKGSTIITDNLTSQGILTCFIKTCKSKNWDMSYH